MPNISQLPKWVSNILSWYCKPDLLEEIEGDIIELYNRRIQSNRLYVAKVFLLLDVIRFCKPSNIKSTSFNLLLLKYHFKVASRSFVKNKSFSFIHIFGFTVGLYATALLLFYVHYEYSFDKHHQHAKNIYRLTHTRIIDGEPTYTKASVFPELGMELQRELTSIKSSARLFTVASEYQPIFSYESKDGTTKQFSESDILLADSTFTKIFDFSWVDGGRSTALNEPNELIVSKSFAFRAFGRTDVTGTQITWKDMGTWTITGVVDDWPENSHLHFDVLASWLKIYGEQSLKRWDGFHTYLLTKPIKDHQQFEDEVNAFSKKYLSSYTDSRSIESYIGIQRLTDIHLKSNLSNEFEINGNRDIVRGLLIMAFAILLIAIFNYINISTSSATHRSKEVGIRKIIGSGSGQIGMQFFIEAFCIVFFAHILTLFLLNISLPIFNQWISSNINLNQWLTSFDFWAFFIANVLTITILSGGYPALLLSRFKALGLVIKSRSTKSFSLRSFLISAQFCFAILFSILAIIVYAQVNYITKKDLGFNKEILIINSMELISDNNDTAFVSKMQTLKHKLTSYSDLEDATLTSHIPGVVNNWVGQIGTVSGDELLNTERIRVDGDFIGTYDLTLLAGRFYKPEDEEHPLQQVVINRKLAESLGFQKPSDAIGSSLAVFNGAVSIIGVIENYHSQSPKQDIMPSFYTLGPGHKSFLSIKINSENKERAVSTARDSWKEFFPDKPFNYFFIEDQLAEQYLADKRLTAALGNFAILAIFLACLGLFGMSNFVTNQKRKELGIRRVFGASYAQILILLSRKQLILLILSALIVTPIALYIAESWLTIHFIIPIASIIIIALGAICFTLINQKKENLIKNLTE